MPLSSRLGGISVAMANRNYRLYTYGAIPSLLGTWIQRTAVGWFAWELTHSGTWLGLVAFASLAPAVFVAPIAGAFADRVDRRQMVLFIQYASMVQALVLAGLTLAGMITIEWLAILSLLQGILQGMNQPFRQALLGSIVTREEMTAAIGINSTIWNTSRLIGPAISSLIVLNFGMGTTFLVNGFTFLPMIATLYMITTAPSPGTGRSLSDVPAEIAEGIRFSASHSFIGPLLLLVFAFSTFGRAVAEILPGYIGAIFHFDIDGLAMLNGAAGLGSLIAGVWLSRRGHLRGLSGILLVNIALLALFQVAFSGSDMALHDPQHFTVVVPVLNLTIEASPDILVGAVVIAFWGFAINACGIIVQSLIQASVPDNIRGRVISLYGMLWLGMPAVGAFVMGAAADLVGFRWPVVFAAALIVAAGIWGLKRRAGFRAEIEAMSGSS